MTEKRKSSAEFCYYEIPNGEDVLALLGADYIQSYGWGPKGEEAHRKHFHNLLEVGICRLGCGEVWIESRKYHYEAGAIYVIPKNIPHAIVSKNAQKSFWEFICVNPAVFLEHCGLVEHREQGKYLELVGHSFCKKKEEVQLLAATVNLLMDQMRTQEYPYRQCVTGLTFALLMEIAKINYRKKSKTRAERTLPVDKTQKIAKALDYIEEHYPERIKASDIAGAAYVSPTYLRRLFQEHCSMTPMQYLNYVRINAACRLMENGDDSMNEVAQKVGYDNIATFINNFKYYKNETPKQWKEQQKSSVRKI